MNIAASAQPVASWLLGTAQHVLGNRLRSLVVYGSAATGDVVRDFSDIDLLLIVNGDVILSDALHLQELARSHDPAPFAYVQPTFLREGAEVPLLVSGTFAVLYGAAPSSASIQSDDDLRRNGSEWLRGLPGLLRDDGVDWSFATVDVHRRARLALTRLKPAIRALLVLHGQSPQWAWATSWEQALDTLDRLSQNPVWPWSGAFIRCGRARSGLGLPAFGGLGGAQGEGFELAGELS